jgi:hypothetical protein
MRRRLAAIGMFAATAAAAFTLGLLVAGGPDTPAPTQVSNVGPDCPTEDSCTPDYRNGKWYIDPVVP